MTGPDQKQRRAAASFGNFSTTKREAYPTRPDDGTLATRAVFASLPFAPEIVLPAISYFDGVYPEMTSKYGFKCSFNPTYSPGSDEENGSGKEWVSKGHCGLDQGPIVLMIENYCSEFLWRLMRDCPHIIEGLSRAGSPKGG